jgi:uncharacterized small protein (DUF1192 family)
MEEVKLKNEKPLTYSEMIKYREFLKAEIARLEAERNNKK